jgi:hypothetical protein
MGLIGSADMCCLLLIVGYEAFNFALGSRSRNPAIAQIEDKARVLRSKTSEFGCGHPGLTKKLFNSPDKHVVSYDMVFRGDRTQTNRPMTESSLAKS